MTPTCNPSIRPLGPSITPTKAPSGKPTIAPSKEPSTRYVTTYYFMIYISYSILNSNFIFYLFKIIF